MIQIAKRSVSLLLALVMVVSMFAGLTLTVSAAQPTSAAEVNYVKSGNYVYNWGKRDTVATFLTTYANSYYTGDYTYEKLYALSGSSATGTGFYTSAMGTAIHNMLVAKQKSTTSYEALKTLFQYTECEESSKTQISSYYSGKSMGSSWGSGWNREHTWPNSKGLDGADENDVMMIKPTLESENSSRGNTAYGKSSSYFDPNGNGQSMHGDVARLMLQHLMRWGNTSKFYGTGGVMESRAVLLEWMEEDPVDTWEMGRNDAVQQITGVRNVFVDYPELAFKLLGAEVPADYQTPSGNGAGTQYSITATSNNTNYGTVSVSGRTITASPKTGYYAKDYTVTSGTATVTQNGNIFTVNASTDCTVRINFAAKQSVTVTLNNNGSISTKTGYAGEAMTLTMPTAPSGYTSVGWVTDQVPDTTTKPTTVYTTSFTPTASCTLYALYSHSVGGGSGSSTEFELYSGAITEGDYLITDSGSTAMKATVSSNRIGYTTVTPSKNVISNPDASLIWHIEASGSYYTIYNASTKKYAAANGTKNNAALSDSSSDDKSLWMASGTSAYEFVNKYNSSKSVNANLRYNSGYGFATYSTGTGKALTLYKAGAGGTTYYTTLNAAPCDHIFTTVVTAPNCTEGGYTTHTCSECGYNYKDTYTDPLGHAYGTAVSNGNGTHTKTCSRCTDKVTEDCDYNITVAGNVTTYTCKTCGAVYTSEATVYTVTYNVLGTVTGSDTCEEGKTVTLPTTATAVDGYKFKGWVKNTIGKETATAPTVLTGSYKPTDNITLYAVYTRTETGAGPGNRFDLVTAATDITDGSYVLIIRANKDSKYYALKQQADDSYVAAAAADSYMGTTVPTTIEVSDASIIWTLAGTSSAFTLKNADASCWLYNSSNKLYYSKTNTAASFKATLRSDNETFTLSPASGRYMGLRSDLEVGTNGLYRFRCNSSASNSDYYFYLYKNAGGTGDLIYYTTNPTTAVTCDHADAYDVAEVSATCTEAGTTAGKYCPDCKQWLSGHTEISALGHDLSEQTTPATCTTAGETVTSCSCCDYSVSTPIAALGHNYDNGVITTAPTATAEGVMTYTCDRCGDFYTSVIPALGEKIPYTRATEITSGGNYIMAFHYTYNGADKWYGIGGVNNSACTIYELPAPVNGVVSLDNGEAFLWTIDAVSDTTNGYSLKNGNSYLKGTSTSTNLSTATTAVTWTAVDGKADDTFWFEIGSRGIGLQNGTSVKDYAVSNANNTGVDYLFDIYLFENVCAHTNTHMEGAKEASCTTNGYTGDKVCDDCGVIVEKGTTILQGHDYVETSRTEATCESAGNIHYECSRCDSFKDEKIEALGHDYQQTAHADATCTEDGYTTYVCSHDESHTYTDTIPAIGHHYDPETGICSGCGDQLATYTVSFTVPAGINAIDPITAFDGTKITLPEPTGTLLANAENYVFAGWVTADVADATDTDFVEAGEYTVTGNVTFKALYSWVGEGSYGDDGVYKLLTEADAASLDTGWMLIIANDGKWQSKTMALADYTSGGNEKFAGKTVTVTNNTITVPASSDVQQFTVVKDADSGYFYLISNYTDSEDTLYYLTSCTNTANANNITLTANPTAAALWSISYHEDGTVKLTAQGSWTANTVQFNSSNYNGFFSCYGETYYGNAPSNIYGIRLFASNPIFHFTTEPTQSCDHLNTSWADNGDGTCSCTCTDCGHIVADNEAHAWVLDETAEGAVAATCTASGKAGYVCSNCGATKLENTEALGHDYVGTETTAPTCSAEGVMTYTCSRCDDSYTESISAVDHSFVNGICTMCGASLYVLVTEAPENWEGEYLIAYVNGENAKVFDGKHDAAANYTVGTFYGEEGNESNLICVPNPDDYTMYFDPCDGGYNIMNSDANWWSFKDAKNGFSVNSSTSFAGKYSISLDASGNAVIKNAGNYTIKFNTAASTSGGDRFRFYGTSIYTTVKLYEKYGTCHHDWVLDEKASTPPASCGVAGNNVYECSICHETKNETVPALQHDYYYNDVPATCTEEGYTECYCHNCDYAEILDYSITEPLGHDFSKLVEDEDHYIAPSCTEPGLAIYQCSRCDVFDTEGTILDPIGHEYENGVCIHCGNEIDAQTYTLMTSLDFANAGSVIMVIKYEDEYYALTEEADGKYLVTKPVTVTDNKITVYDEGDYAIMMPFTNVNDGENVGYGFETAERNYLHVNSKGVAFAYETANAALAITQAEVWTGEYDSNDNPKMKKVPNAWFLQGKATGKFISNYIDTYEDTELSVIDDSFFAVPVYFYASTYTKPVEPEPSTHNLYHFEGYAATCTEDGYAEYYTCLDGDCDCAGKMYADPYCTIEITDLTIPALGHDYQWDSEMGNGYHGVACSRCDATDLVECTMVDGTCSICGYTEAAEVIVKINSAALRLGENIDLIYTASVPEDATNVYMTFTMNGESVTVADDGTHTFAFTAINPQCMGDNVAAKLYATVSGTEYTDEIANYSVRQYCINKLADESISAAARTLISDVLAYGAAAQTYMSYNTSAPVNVGSDIKNPTCSTYKALSGYASSFRGTAAEDVCWVAAGLTLTNSVAMTFRFYAASVDGLTVNVEINGRTQTFTASDFIAVDGKSNTYEISFKGIKANEFADSVTASFARNGAQIGNTVSYSVNTYICAKQADSNANLAALVKALYNYGASAAAYAG